MPDSALREHLISFRPGLPLLFTASLPLLAPKNPKRLPQIIRELSKNFPTGPHGR